jgi:uncharacterized membrane protein
VAFECNEKSDSTLKSERKEKNKNIANIIKAVFLSISIVFLLFTVAAYFVAPKMRNLHGKSIASQAAALMVAFLALVLIMLGVIKFESLHCRIFGLKILTEFQQF